MQTTELDLTGLTADIVSAYVANNAIGGDKLPDLIGSVYGALSRASPQAVEPEKVELKPAVAIKKSVTPEYIICLEGRAAVFSVGVVSGACGFEEDRDDFQNARRARGAMNHGHPAVLKGD